MELPSDTRMPWCRLDSNIEDKGEEYKGNFYEALWNYNAVDGETYGLPVGYTTHVVYYNKDLFDAAGIEYPQAVDMGRLTGNS